MSGLENIPNQGESLPEEPMYLTEAFFVKDGKHNYSVGQVVIYGRVGKTALTNYTPGALNYTPEALEVTFPARLDAEDEAMREMPIEDVAAIVATTFDFTFTHTDNLYPYGVAVQGNSSRRIAEKSLVPAIEAALREKAFQIDYKNLIGKDYKKGDFGTSVEAEFQKYLKTLGEDSQN